MGAHPGNARRVDPEVAERRRASHGTGGAMARAPLPGRRDPCPCGSGESYEACHLAADTAAAVAARRTPEPGAKLAAQIEQKLAGDPEALDLLEAELVRLGQRGLTRMHLGEGPAVFTADELLWLRAVLAPYLPRFDRPLDESAGPELLLRVRTLVPDELLAGVRARLAAAQRAALEPAKDAYRELHAAVGGAPDRAVVIAVLAEQTRFVSRDAAEDAVAAAALAGQEAEQETYEAFLRRRGLEVAADRVADALRHLRRHGTAAP